MATPAIMRESPPFTKYAARPAKTAASAIRSRVESRNAPHAPLLPLIRASVPSSMSVNTNTVHTITPASRCPVGNSASAPPDTPRVPTTVTMFGVTGVRASHWLTGVSKRVKNGRRTFSMATRSYWRPGGPAPVPSAGAWAGQGIA